MPDREITIRPGCLNCLSYLARCDFSFEVVEERCEPFDSGRTIPVEPSYRKTYNFSPDELATCIGGVDRELFVANAEGRPVGYVALSRGWNSYAIVEDIAVDASHRRLGIARRLIDTGIEWTRKLALAGISLETQSNNAAACRFYQGYGFVLGGYDRYLYQAMHPGTREVALFWYLPLLAYAHRLSQNSR
ncbi:GNAT family N-acetyltransferase [Sinorhizobium meliloti]|uniref:GNAT family N-acetyltransferase n=1 Tax=Rhizobium meliloti TaxID=382 RepID=UPI00398D6697